MTTVLGLGTSVYLYLDNRALRAAAVAGPASVPAPDSASAVNPYAPPVARSGKIGPILPTTEPKLAPPDEESRLERRQRRQQEMAARFGRHDGETEEAYRQRVAPLITAGLALPRIRVAENRRAAEEKAGVTPAQSQQLDQAFDKVYADVLDYTNKAVVDGQLSPYERNVAGWLDFAGGLGGMLGETQGQIGKILTPDQVKVMSESGFEWGEYLGLQTPWEQLTPPPPPPAN